MTAPTTDRDALLDFADISGVLVRYATGIDRRDRQLLRTCFTDNCQADHGETGRWHGADALTAYRENAHAHCGHLMHRVTNPDVTLGGDTATARSYCDPRPGPRQRWRDAGDRLLRRRTRPHRPGLEDRPPPLHPGAAPDSAERGPAPWRQP